MQTFMQTNYFYAEEDAGLYDATVDLTTESYGLLHCQVERLVTTWRHDRKASGAPLILDIGAGTGAEALRILRTVPDAKLLCVDASPSMLEALHRKVAAEFGDPTAGGRCQTVVADACQPGWLSALSTAMGFEQQPFSLIVSVYLYHHLPADWKGKIYNEIFDHLANEGAFIHGDLFSFSDKQLSAKAQDLEDNWLTNCFKDRAVCAQLGLSENEASRLLENWLRHFREDNVPIPIHSENSDDEQTEMGLLRRAGFRSVEVPFRLFQNGVFVARP